MGGGDSGSDSIKAKAGWDPVSFPLWGFRGPLRLCFGVWGDHTGVRFGGLSSHTCPEGVPGSALEGEVSIMVDISQ